MYSYKELAIALAWQYYEFIMRHNLLGCLSIFCVSSGISLPVFAIYHIRNMADNVTTNEQMKTKKLDFGLRNQVAIVMSLMAKIRRDHKPDEKELPRIKIDGEELPLDFEGRMDYLQMKTDSLCEKRNILGPKRPYKPRSCMEVVQYIFSTEPLHKG